MELYRIYTGGFMWGKSQAMLAEYKALIAYYNELWC